jgi:porin
VRYKILAAVVAAHLAGAMPAFAQNGTGSGTGTPGSTGSTATPAAQAAVPTQAPLTVKDWVNRPQMLGDWGGARTRAEDNGFQLGASWTQFFQWAPMTSPNGDTRDYLYGGKADFRATGDFGKMNDKWNGLSAAAHVEFRYGEVPLLPGGTFVPVNSALLMPGREDFVIDITSIYVTKMFGDTMMLQAGRFNMFDNYERPFTGGGGTEKFNNLAFVLPPLLARTTPMVAEGVFFSTLKDGDPRFTVGLYESTRDGFFKNGATVFGALNMPLKIWEAPGHYTVTGTFSSVEATSLDQSDYVLVPTPVVTPVLATKSNAWTIDVKFDQYLLWDPATKTGFGVFGMFGASDANPSVVDIFGHVGIGGTSPIPGRTNDSFGAGYYFNGISNTLIDTLAPAVRLRDENGFEGYYNVAVTGWSKVQGDVQFVDPFAVGSKTRWFFSIRWKLNF